MGHVIAHFDSHSWNGSWRAPVCIFRSRLSRRWLVPFRLVHGQISNGNRPYRCKDRRIGPKAMKFFTQSRARCGRVIESMNVFGRDVHSLSRTCLATRAARLVERRLRFRQSARDTRQFEISSAHSAAPSLTHGSSDLRHTSVAARALRDVGSALEETPLPARVQPSAQLQGGFFPA